MLRERKSRESMKYVDKDERKLIFLSLAMLMKQCHICLTVVSLQFVTYLNETLEAYEY